MSIRFVCKAATPASRLFASLTTKVTMVNKEVPHLKTGDAQPPLQKGLLRLYNMRFCPYAQRAVLVLDAKKVPYDIVNCNLTTKPEWLFQKSEGAKVPAIEFEDGQVLSESLIICDYLDEVYPEPPLQPKDPRKKAQEKLLVEKFGAVTRQFFKIIVGENGFTSENFEEFIKAVNVFEEELAQRGTTFFGGSQPGMLDFMIWPWVERAPLLQIRGGENFEFPKSRLPVLSAWKDAMLADPVVRQSALPPAVHNQFWELRKNAIYDFEFDSHL